MGLATSSRGSIVAAHVARTRASERATTIALPPSTQSKRARAATAAALSDINECAQLRPYYWEIGDRDGKLVGGSVNREFDPMEYTADTVMRVASASKWMYASYVVERKFGLLNDTDIRHLTLRSGYTSFTLCPPNQTVGECMEFGNNGEYTDKHDGVFYYGGGHMQQHAILNGLGGRDAAGLTREVRSKIGRDVSFFFDLPEVAGGVATSPGEYAKFLRKILRGELRISRMLGSYAVCGSPRACPLQAERTAAPRDEAWHYSLGHWVEDDPDEGDGAFSSLGLFGFYPWIDESMTYYGIVASEGLMEVPSALDCGRVIRAAWMTLPAR